MYTYKVKKKTYHLGDNYYNQGSIFKYGHLLKHECLELLNSEEEPKIKKQFKFTVQPESEWVLEEGKSKWFKIKNTLTKEYYKGSFRKDKAVEKLRELNNAC